MDVSAKIDTAPIKKILADIEKDFDKATMYGLRAAGRVGKQEAKKAAPVYDGDDPRAEKGRLKNSIHSAKRLKRLGKAHYSLTVGPFGGAVTAYRTKANEQHHYMDPALAAVTARMNEQFVKAYTRTLEKRGRL